MIRKLRLVILLLISAVRLFAEAGLYRQYQSFSWKPVDRVKKYEVTVERKNDDGSWSAGPSVQTGESRVELLLLPGSYRVAISAFNVLGRKASTSEWIPFRILEETEPFLFADQFPSDAETALPVLSLGAGTEVGADTFSIKGKNIFFEESSFDLEPAADTGKIVSYDNPHQVVPLKIVSRDRDSQRVVVSYDPELVSSGVYRIVVKNPGTDDRTTASLAVLVRPGKPAQINESVFSWDDRYKTRTVTLGRSADSLFTVQGKNFAYDTVFLLKPAEGIPYPFASAVPHGVLHPRVVSYRAAGGGETELKFSYDTSDVQTGYYLLTAQTPGTKESSCLLLVTAAPDPGKEQPEITTIKSRYLKKSGLVEVTLAGSDLDSDGVATLVAPCTADGLNVRIPLELVNFADNRKKVVLTAKAALLSAGAYVVLFETNGFPLMTYADVAKNYSMKLMDIPDEKRDEIFLRRPDMDIPAESAEVRVVSTDIVPVPLDDTSLEQLTFEKTHIVYGKKTGSSVQYVSDIYPVKGSGYEHFIRSEPVAGGQNALHVDSVPNRSGWISAAILPGESCRLLGSGDSVRFRIDARSTISAWFFELSYDTPEGIVSYYMDLSASKKIKGHDDAGDYYQFDYSYRDFFQQRTIGQKRMPLDISLVSRCAFRNRRQNMKSSLSVRNMEVYNSATGVPTRLVKKVPHLLTNGALQLGAEIHGVKVGDSFVMRTGAEAALIDWQWIALTAAVQVPFATSEKTLDTAVSVRFVHPGDFFEPYISGGLGKRIALDEGSSRYFAPIAVGMRLSRMLDVRYTMNVQNVLSPYGPEVMYMTDSVSFGITFWQRKEVRYRIPVERPEQKVEGGSE